MLRILNQKTYFNISVGHFILGHIIYWVILIAFFSYIWGTYDNNYYRNFMIQLHTLPSRLILVYVTLFYLFPIYFSKGRLLTFAFGYFIVLIICTLAIQRTMIFFIVEGKYFDFHSERFFNVAELTNTMMDVNIAAIIPVAAHVMGSWLSSKRKLNELQIQNTRLKNQTDQYILFRRGSSKHKIFLHEIVFVESQKNNIRVSTAQKEHIFYGSISKIQEALKGQPFVRIHRSFIVNLNQVDSFNSGNVVVKGHHLPIGRKYKEEVLRQLTR